VGKVLPFVINRLTKGRKGPSVRRDGLDEVSGQVATEASKNVSDLTDLLLVGRALTKSDITVDSVIKTHYSLWFVVKRLSGWDNQGPGSLSDV